MVKTKFLAETILVTKAQNMLIGTAKQIMLKDYFWLWIKESKTPSSKKSPTPMWCFICFPNGLSLWNFNATDILYMYLHTTYTYIPVFYAQIFCFCPEKQILSPYVKGILEKTFSSAKELCPYTAEWLERLDYLVKLHFLTQVQVFFWELYSIWEKT